MNKSDLEKTPVDLIPNNVSIITQWILYSVLCQLICVFGIVTNIVNIICFVKQGFKDPVNVSFMGKFGRKSTSKFG
jgi:hypothetical protein